MRRWASAFLAYGFALGAEVPAGIAADSWGLQNERPLVIVGTVVDVACQLGQDCPPACGRGWRQLGIVNAEGRLYMVGKAVSSFAGPVLDLLPFCGKTVEADGLLIDHPAMPLYFAQYLRGAADQPWIATNGFQDLWPRRHGALEGDWMREDPLVRATIARQGILGIPGLKPD